MTTEKRPNWLLLEAEYLAGGVSYQDLADRHGVTKRTIERHGSDGNWEEKRRLVAEQVAAEIPGQVAQQMGREVSDFIAGSLEAAGLALTLAMEKMQTPGLEFKSLGEAMTAIAKLTKVQADLATMAGTHSSGAADIAAALDELDWETMDPAEAVKRYREACKEPASNRLSA
jgi:hypothetical protein